MRKFYYNWVYLNNKAKEMLWRFRVKIEGKSIISRKCKRFLLDNVIFPCSRFSVAEVPIAKNERASALSFWLPQLSAIHSVIYLVSDAVSWRAAKVFAARLKPQQRIWLSPSRSSKSGERGILSVKFGTTSTIGHASSGSGILYESSSSDCHW